MEASSPPNKPPNLHSESHHIILWLWSLSLNGFLMSNCSPLTPQTWTQALIVKNTGLLFYVSVPMFYSLVRFLLKLCLRLWFCDKRRHLHCPAKGSSTACLTAITVWGLTHRLLWQITIIIIIIIIIIYYRSCHLHLLGLKNSPFYFVFFSQCLWLIQFPYALLDVRVILLTITFLFTSVNFARFYNFFYIPNMVVVCRQCVCYYLTFLFTTIQLKPAVECN